MKKIESGVLAAAHSLPCSPKVIALQRFTLMGTLSRMEEEEMAARILSFSQWHDQWVGVTLERLTEMLLEEKEAHQRHSDAITLYHQAQERHERKLHSYYKKCLLSLGIYALFANKPQAPAAPTWAGPMSIVQIYGPRAMTDGLHDLINQGLVQHVPVDTESGEENIFFPLPKLIERIMLVQKTPATA